MEEILSILWFIGCSTVLPIIIVWMVTRKQINETNKRTEIMMSALEKNPDVNVAEWLDKLAPEKKGKLLKEKLMTKLTWGIICLILFMRRARQKNIPTKFRKPRTALSRGERTAAYFINVPMIISIIYLLYTTYTFITWPS